MSNVKDKIIRHAHFVERYKTGQANRINAYIKRVDAVVRDNLTRADMIASRKEMLVIQRNVRIEVYAIYKEWANEMNINLVDFAHSEVGFSARAIGGGLSIPSKHILEA
ncbi:MAG: hypothetical protein GY810_14070, partial [Aureispira sp.]|nr:hypothetical protein [Aureispira sp.]